jgi:peptide deformylase
MNVKVLDIVKWYNPILTIPAEAVRDFNGDLASLAENMIATMNAYNGLGLAGPQAAASLRIFVMKNKKESLVACNPRILIHGPETVMDEGCLSLPGVYNQVSRGTKVDMKYTDVLGNERDIYLEGLEARIIQHEVDHLNGILFVDRMSRQMRSSTLREYTKKFPHASQK